MSARLRERAREGQLAVMLLTRLPAGRLRGPAPPLAAARWAFPLVGLVTGAIVWAVLHLALWSGLAAFPAAGIAMLAVVLVTGGLHHDGLADLADGLGGGRDRADALRIMRDSRIGSFGALALVLAVGLGAAALGAAAEALTPAALMLAAVASRLVMLAVLIALPPARAEGLGQGAAAGSRADWLAGAIATLALALAVGPAAIPALLAAAGAGGAVAARAVRRLGGQTGDVLGTVQVAAETAAWLALSAALSG